MKCCKETGALVLRLFFGVFFLSFGAMKLFGGLEATTGMFTELGFPAASFLALVVALVEFLGGLALILGFFTRWFALLLTVVMLVAVFTVHWKNGWHFMNGGWSMHFALIGGLLSLFFSGSGKCSLEQSLL